MLGLAFVVVCYLAAALESPWDRWLLFPFLLCVLALAIVLPVGVGLALGRAVAAREHTEIKALRPLGVYLGLGVAATVIWLMSR